jgi:hypothetical protein
LIKRNIKEKHKNKIHLPQGKCSKKKNYQKKNVNNACQKPQLKTKRKNDDHQKTKDSNIKKIDKKTSTPKKIYHVDFYMLNAHSTIFDLKKKCTY